MPHLMDGVSLVGCGSWHGMQAYSRGTSCNVYVIDGKSELALVDAGEREAVQDVLKNIRSLGLDPGRIRKVFLTHSHGDHSSGLTELLRQVDAKVYAHPVAKETLQGGTGIYRHGFQPLERVLAPVHELVKEGDTVRVGTVELTIHEFPGHTPDGLGFSIALSAGRGCFTGDTAIGDQPMQKGVIGWLDYHWGPKLTDYRTTLKRLRAMELSAFFGGHGNAQMDSVSVRDSLDHCLAGLERLMSVPNLEWLIAIDV
jgi:glyoxylase-like metal-dependent hydrolase (beta-lactamase superfamily II)